MNNLFKRLIKVLLLTGFVFAMVNTLSWKDSVKNPNNSAFVVECAFNLDCEPWEVTQTQFNRRYLTK